MEHFTDKQILEFGRLQEKMHGELGAIVRSYLGRLPHIHILGAIAHIDMAARDAMCRQANRPEFVMAMYRDVLNERIGAFK